VSLRRGLAQPAPFVLALPGPSTRRGSAATARLRLRRDRLVDELARLDAACWLGRLDRRGLWRMQALRVRFADLDRQVAAHGP